MDNGQWIMDNGQRTMDNGQWTTDNGQPACMVMVCVFGVRGELKIEN